MAVFTYAVSRQPSILLNPNVTFDFVNSFREQFPLPPDRVPAEGAPDGRGGAHPPQL